MPALKIWLFGNFKIAPDSSADTIFLPHLEQALLAYLLLYRHQSHSREVLADIFWQDHDGPQARRCLNTALWRLKKTLAPVSTDQVLHIHKSSNGDIGFNRSSDYWLDVETFETYIAKTLNKSPQLLDEGNILQMEQASDLCQGELLQGFYQDWALRERERLRMLYLRCLRRMMGYYSQRCAYGRALAIGQRILECDPLREDIYREMMRIYCETGQRAHAIKQYRQCREQLMEELGIEPMRETQKLYEDIIEGGYVRGTCRSQFEEDTQLDRALLELQKARETCAEAALQLQCSTEVVDRLMGPRMGE